MTGGQPRRELLRLLKGSGFIFACRICGAVLTLGTQVLLARWMGAAELGVYVLAFSWCVLLGTLSTAGFSPAAMRFVNMGLAAGEPGYIRAFIKFGYRVVIAVGGLFTLAGLTGLWLAGQLEQTALVTALIIVPVYGVLHYTCAVANGYSRFALGFLPTMVFRPLLFCLLIAAAWLFLPEVSAGLAMGMQAAAVATIAGLTLLVFRAFLAVQATGPATPARREWTRTALSLLIGALFTGYFPEIIIILAGWWLPSDELAVLHISFRIAMLVSFGLFAIDAFTAPEVTRLHAAGDLPGLQRVVNRATRLRFWAGAVSVMVFVLLGRWLLGLFGPEFVAGYALLLILSAGQFVQGAAGPVVRLMSVSGHQDRCLPVFAVSLVASVALIAVLVPLMGASGAALAASLVMMLWAVWIRQLTVRYLGVRPRMF